MLAWLLIAVGSIILTEFYGYWLHVLQHTDKIRWLSAQHMNHHLHRNTYPPGSNMRPSKTYKHHATKEPLLKYGPEWIVPAVILIGFTIFLESFILDLTALQTAVSIIMMVMYAYIVMGWLHDTMHIKGHWLSKNRITKRYYRYIVRLHDIHHHYIISGGDKKGLLPYNLGISTPMFDKVFGTYLSNMRGKSRKQILAGYQAGLQRYKMDGENNEDNKEATTATH